MLYRHPDDIGTTVAGLLLEQHDSVALSSADIIRTITVQWTSLRSLKPKSFTEPTSSIVWSSLLEAQINTRDVILWNAFPWHPYQPDQGLLSNHLPSKDEFLRGLPVLHQLIDMIKPKEIIAMGNSAQLQLQSMGYASSKVRHPARGGATEFRQQISDLLVVSDSCE